MSVQRWGTRIHTIQSTCTFHYRGTPLFVIPARYIHTLPLHADVQFVPSVRPPSSGQAIGQIINSKGFQKEPDMTIRRSQRWVHCVPMGGLTMGF